GLAQYRISPVPLECEIRRVFASDFGAIGELRLDPNRLLASAALGRARGGRLVGEEMPQRNEQEGAEPAARTFGDGEGPVAQQLLEERLGEVLRLLRGMTVATHAREHGWPIDAAQLRERARCDRRETARIQNQAPTRGVEPRHSLPP